MKIIKHIQPKNYYIDMKIKNKTKMFSNKGQIKS